MLDKFIDFLLNFYGPTPYLLILGVLLLCGAGLPVPDDFGDFWRDFEAGLFPRVEAAVAALPPAGADRDAAAGHLVADAWARASAALDGLTERVRAL